MTIDDAFSPLVPGDRNGVKEVSYDIVRDCVKRFLDTHCPGLTPIVEFTSKEPLANWNEVDREILGRAGLYFCISYPGWCVGWDPYYGKRWNMCVPPNSPIYAGITGAGLSRETLKSRLRGQIRYADWQKGHDGQPGTIWQQVVDNSASKLMLISAPRSAPRWPDWIEPLEKNFFKELNPVLPKRNNNPMRSFHACVELYNSRMDTLLPASRGHTSLK